jgi:hypothetical protein
LLPAVPPLVPATRRPYLTRGDLRIHQAVRREQLAEAVQYIAGTDAHMFRGLSVEDVASLRAS